MTAPLTKARLGPGLPDNGRACDRLGSADRVRFGLGGELLAERPDVAQAEAAGALRILREALDELAHVPLPALVVRIVRQLLERGVEVVALDQMEQIPAAAPDPPVGDSGPLHGG